MSNDIVTAVLGGIVAASLASNKRKSPRGDEFKLNRKLKIKFKNTRYTENEIDQMLGKLPEMLPDCTFTMCERTKRKVVVLIEAKFSKYSDVRNVETIIERIEDELYDGTAKDTMELAIPNSTDYGKLHYIPFRRHANTNLFLNDRMEVLVKHINRREHSHKLNAVAIYQKLLDRGVLDANTRYIAVPNSDYIHTNTITGYLFTDMYGKETAAIVGKYHTGFLSKEFDVVVNFDTYKVAIGVPFDIVVQALHTDILGITYD